MKHIVISLLNFNGKKNTLDCLESLRNIKTDNFKLTISVIDNASEEEFDLNDKTIGNIPLIFTKNNQNLGFSGGHNVTIRHALSVGADYVLILNNDTYVDQNFIKELLDVAKKENNIGILVPKIYFAPGSEYHKDRYTSDEKGKVLWYAGGEMDWKNIIGHHRGVDEVDRGQYDKIEETELATGCCMLIKNDVFKKIGLLNDKYFLYYEDSDFSMRAKNAGFKIMYVPTSMVWHKNAGSTGGSGSALQDYYITRNRLMFGFLYSPLRSRLALFKESLILLLKGRMWQRRGIMDFYMSKLGKGSYV
jgi:GT2 family glycosyltransferase